MFLHSLATQGFRNLCRQQLSFTSVPALIFGENGQGKTNLLEAILFGCTAALWRAQHDEEAIGWNEEIARIELKVEKARGETVTTEVALSRNGATLFKINGAPRRRGEFVGVLPVICFSGEDLQIIKGEPFRRRQFLNLEISQINRSYRWNLLHYSRALEQRNRLLKELREGRGERKSLVPWEEGLAKYGSRLMEIRAQFLAQLEAEATRYLELLHSGWKGLQLVYQPALRGEKEAESEEALRSAAELAPVLMEGFARNREEEIQRGFSLVGPHRDDFELLLAEVDQRTYGSQGQQRSLALALRLALAKMVETVVEEPPLLLLDDVFSELDQARRLGMGEALGEESQFFLTTSSLEEIPAPLQERGQHFRLHAGRAERESEESAECSQLLEE